MIFRDYRKACRPFIRSEDVNSSPFQSAAQAYFSPGHRRTIRLRRRPRDSTWFLRFRRSDRKEHKRHKRHKRGLMTRGISTIVLASLAAAVLAAPLNHVVMTSQQDRQRIMDQLKITLFPSGPGAYLASTYDEKTANPYPTLPDPLTFNDGSKVKNASQWRKRRAEILELFDREVYGRRPKNIAKVTWMVASTTEGKAGSVPVVTKQLVGRVDNSGYPDLNVTILATLSTPKNATHPVPVVLMFGNGGTLPEGVPPTTPCTLPGAAPAG